MTIKKFYLLLFYLITLVGCNNFQTDKSDKNFQNYFVKPDWFEKPKIYVYENKSIGDSEKYIVYRYYEKINDNKLKYIVYDKDFNQIQIIIYEYLEDKVIITELSTIETWNNNRKVNEKVIENVVFDYKNINKEFRCTHSSRFKGYPYVTKYATRKIKKFEKVKYDGNEINVLIVEGITKGVFKIDSKYKTSTNNEKYVFADNIGLIHLESKNPSSEIVEDLTSIISVEDFNKMKNER